MRDDASILHAFSLRIHILCLIHVLSATNDLVESGLSLREHLRLCGVLHGVWLHFILRNHIPFFEKRLFFDFLDWLIRQTRHICMHFIHWGRLRHEFLWGCRWLRGHWLEVNYLLLRCLLLLRRWVDRLLYWYWLLWLNLSLLRLLWFLWWLLNELFDRLFSIWLLGIFFI